MDCRLFALLIERYYDGALDLAERSEYENHRRLCAACRALEERYALVDSALGRLPLFEPSPDFDRRVMARVDVAAYRVSPARRAFGALGAVWNAVPAAARNGIIIAAVCAVFIAVYKPLLDFMIDTIQQGAEGVWSGMVFMKVLLGKAEVVWKEVGAVRTYQIVGETLARTLHRVAAGFSPLQIAAAITSLILVAFVLLRTVGAARRKGETNVGIL